jgi:uncharacterized MnhB-related membrane protein
MFRLYISYQAVINTTIFSILMCLCYALVLERSELP